MRLLIRGSGLVVGAQTFERLVQALVGILLARVLGTANYGLYSYSLAYADIVCALSAFGIHEYVFRQLSSYHRSAHGESPGRLFFRVWAFHAFASTVSMVCAGVVWHFFNRERPLYGLLFIVLCIGTVQNWRTFCQNGLMAMRCARGNAKGIVAGKIVSFGLFLVAVILQLHFYLLVSVVLIGVFAEFLILLRVFLLSYDRDDSTETRSAWPNISGQGVFLSTLMPFALIGVAVTTYFQLDSLMIGLLRDGHSVGLYNAAYRTVLAVVFPAIVLSQAFLSTYSAAATCRDFSRRLIALALMLGAAGVILSVILYLSSDSLIVTLFGEDYTGAISSFRIIVWLLPVIFVTSFLGRLLIFFNYEWPLAKGLLAATLMNGLLNWVLIRLYGIEGAAVATILTEALILVYQSLLVIILLRSWSCD